MALLLCLPLIALTGPPDTYYDAVDATNSTSLRSTLLAVVDDHTRICYRNGSPNTSDVVELADEDPNNASNILDVYNTASYPKFSEGNDFYSRSRAINVVRRSGCHFVRTDARLSHLAPSLQL